jgi:formylglycine-generating enzyme required for sulfatase activity
MCVRRGAALPNEGASRLESTLAVMAAEPDTPDAASWRQSMPARITILVLSSSPGDQANLKTNEEWNLIREAIRTSRSRDVINVEFRPSVKPADLLDALREIQPEVLHFCGHGSPTSEIILQANDGSSRPVPSQKFEEILESQGQSIRIVVLNACFSRNQAERIVRYADCAIGMNDEIPDDTALAFAVAFYRGLAEGESVQQAFKSSLLQIDMMDLSRALPRHLSGGAAGAAEVKRPIPELIPKAGKKASEITLVSREPSSTPPGPLFGPPPSEGTPGDRRPTDAAEIPATHRSRGLPIDRSLGGMIGGVLVVTSAVILVLHGSRVVGSLLPGGLELPAWSWVVLAGVFLVGVLLLGRWPYRQSRLLRPDALRLDPNDPRHFRGRKDDISRLIHCCRNYPLTFLVGHSGVGKSALVRLGLCTSWPADAALTPLLIDQWGSDWAAGPRDAVAQALDRLGHRQERLLLLFDQLDDYQISHRQHFLTDGVAVWKGADAIVAENPFWANIRELLEEGRLHCLFATRSDASIGLASMTFTPEPQQYELARLPVEDIRPLFDLLTRPQQGSEVVSDPEYGWDDLKDRIARDLTVDGLVLPIQLKVALHALRYLDGAGGLSVAAYERVGGLKGLEALAVRQKVAEVATTVGLDSRVVLRLLVALVDRTAMKSVSVPSGPLVDAAAPGASEETKNLLGRAISMLEQREIVRRTISIGTGEESWILDHDYLCRGVLEADRRARKWQATLDDAFLAWERAEGRPWVRWWSGLLDPRQQAVLLWRRLWGQLRFGESRGYALRSLIRLTPYILALALVGWYVPRVWNSEARSLVEQIARDDPADVPASVTQLAEYPRRAERLLRNQLGRERSPRKKLNLMQALVSLAPAETTKFYRLLVDDDPGDLATRLKSIDRGPTDGCKDLWGLFCDEHADSKKRLHAACLLAKYAPPADTSPETVRRWRVEGPGLVKLLLPSVVENPVDYKPLCDLLEPSKSQLLGPLSGAFRDLEGKASERFFATSFLAAYVTAPAVRADLLPDAGPELFKVLFPAFVGPYLREGPPRVLMNQQVDRFLDSDPVQLPVVLAAEEKCKAFVSALEVELHRPIRFPWEDKSSERPRDTLPETVKRELERYQGLVEEPFALCQELPLTRFQALSKSLSESGYRAARIRPFATNGVIRVAAVWLRDGVGSRTEFGLTAKQVNEQGIPGRAGTLLPLDVSGYVETLGGQKVDRYAVTWVETRPGTQTARFEMFADLPVEEVPDKRRRLEREGLACSTFQGLVGADGKVRFCGIFDTERATRPRRFNLSETQRGHELAMFQVAVPGQGTRDDLEALDVSVYYRPDPVDLPQLSHGQLRDGELATGRDDDDAARCRRAWLLFRMRDDTAVLHELAPLIEAKRLGLDENKLLAYAHARMGQDAAARKYAETIVDGGSTVMDRRCVDAVVAAYGHGPDRTKPIAEMVEGEGEYRHYRWAIYEAACAYALMSDAAGKDAALRGRHGATAMKLLSRAIECGLDDLEDIQVQPRLDPLRSRADFARLIEPGKPGRHYADVWIDPLADASGENASRKGESEFIRAETHGDDPVAHLKECKRLAGQGFRPVSISATEVDGLTRLIASIWRRPKLDPDERDRQAIRRANVAVTLLLVDRPEQVWPLLQLRSEEDPTVRSHLIHSLARYRRTLHHVWTRLQALNSAQLMPVGTPHRTMDEALFDPNRSERQALILILGQSARDRLPEPEKTIAAMQELYRSDPDAGIHGAAEWALRRWSDDQSDLLAEANLDVKGEPLNTRSWRVNSEGFTMVEVAGPVEFLMGSPPDQPGRYHGGEEIQRRVRINRRYLIATKEVSRGQYQRFLDRNPQYRKLYSTTQASPSTEGPRVTVSWYRAADFCNSLSALEGFTPCYLPNSKNQYAEGMRLAPNFLELDGYRLPTEAEWEYACRAGTLTTWYHGESATLLGEYAWFQKNSGDHARSLGMLKPNDLGLFDMIGNSIEWCGASWWDSVSFQSPIPRDDVAYPTSVGFSEDRRFQRGGSYFYASNLTRSAARNMARPATTEDMVGFRIVRTIPERADRPRGQDGSDK